MMNLLPRIALMAAARLACSRLAATVGYINVGGAGSRPFGIVTDLGYEPANGRTLASYTAYRSEWLFASPVVSINSLSLGLSIRI